MFSPAYKRYVLAVVTAVYTLNYLDSGLMTLLLQPIKMDLHLTDTQLGFATGIAFGIFYALLGIPIAQWADRGNRSTIASIAIALWGLTVMACVFVGNFVQLVAARIAAGVGESGCLPPTYSLIGDYFPTSTERTRAMGIYMLANPLSALASFMLGGWLNERYGWRLTFLLMGIPALFIAVIVKFTVIEPRTRVAERRAQETAPRILDVAAALWQGQSSRHLTAALILLLAVGAGLGPWFGAFMVRSHGMRTDELGMWLGLIFGFSGILGIVLGSRIASRWFASNEQGHMRFTAITVCVLVPCFASFLLLPRRGEALASLAIFLTIFNLFIGPVFSLLQRLVVDRMRATALALVMLLVNIIGAGMAPEIVGILSDRLQPRLGKDSLKCAMLLMIVISLWAAYHFWKVGDSVTADLDHISKRNQAGGYLEGSAILREVTCNREG